MARLEVAKNVWWPKMTYTEQVEYLKSHPKSKLKMTRRRPRKSKEEQPGQKDGSRAEDVEQKTKELDSSTNPSEQQEVIDAVVNNEGTLELNAEERDAAAEVLSEQTAEAFEKDRLDEKFGEDDKADFEDEFEEILNEDDSERRSTRFLSAALRFAVKAGVITAAIALAGGSPGVLFVPSVMASIWGTATDWSDRTGSLFDTAADSVHKIFKNGAQDHITHGVRKEKRAE